MEAEIVLSESNKRQRINNMQTVIIECKYSSDYAGGIELNRLYAIQCIADCAKRKEAGFAPGIHYTQKLDGTFAQELSGKSDPTHYLTREEGFEMILAFRLAADKTVFYLDHGWSSGMLAGKEQCIKYGKPYEERYLNGHPGLYYYIAGSTPKKREEFIKTLMLGVAAEQNDKIKGTRYRENFSYVIIDNPMDIPKYDEFHVVYVSSSDFTVTAHANRVLGAIIKLC